MKKNNSIILLGKSPQEISNILSPYGFPSYTAQQISQWIYTRKVTDFSQMSNISAVHREKLSQLFSIGAEAPTKERISKDGTRKYLFTLNDPDAAPSYVETVYIPDRERSTLCISSQAGCRMNCDFCATGSQGFSQSLSATQILNQFYSLPFSDQISHFVFMGMGEPFDNTEEVLKALHILSSPQAFAFSPRRITVSTVGILPGLQRFLDESECHLAISLHSPFPEERAAWIPVEKKYPATEIIGLLQNYDFIHQRKLSFEYILFGGQNDDLTHAQALIKLLKGINGARVNLILYHPIPGKKFVRPKAENAFLFRDYLTQHGLFATLRQSRGEDIEAACGLLSQQKK